MKLAPRVVYLVVPGYTGPLPARDLFTPACLAQGVALPRGIEVIGPDRIEWSEDQCAAAEAALIERGHQVIVLR